MTTTAYPERSEETGESRDRARSELSSPLSPDYSLAADPPRCRLGFALFILVNAVLFVRPAELLPAIENWPIYEVLILACLFSSIPAVLQQLTWRSLSRNPITVCVIGLLAAVFLSHASHRDFWSARMGAIMFLKIVIYYLLLVGLVDSPKRLRLFIGVLFAFILTTAALALLNHHGTIDVPALSELEEGYGDDPITGEPNFIYRLRAMGIFNDPNDFALILNAAIFIGLHYLISQRRWLLKLAWAVPVVPLAYALYLTQSRGGFLSLLVGLVVLLFTRVRWKRAILICAVLLPAIFAGAGGRLTNINLENNNDTAQGRVQLWRDCLVEFHGVPFFGLGEGTLWDQIGHVAHNSYVHSYAELGFFGGTLFCGAFYLAVTGVRRLKAAGDEPASDELRSLRLCLLPVLAAYLMGLYSLSRTYGNSTYVVLGLAGALVAIAAGGLPGPQLSFKLARQLVLVSIGCVFYFEVFVRVFAN